MIRVARRRSGRRQIPLPGPEVVVCGELEVRSCPKLSKVYVEDRFLFVYDGNGIDPFYWVRRPRGAASRSSGAKGAERARV